jgi:hypothetical protein
MEELNLRLDELAEKAKTLSIQFVELQEAYERMVLENKDLKIKVEEQEKNILELKNNITLLKVSSSAHSISGPDESKKKIDDMVREIDKCIALLNR